MTIPPSVIAEVRDREDGHCAACGWPLGVFGGVLHHRRLRSHGGRDDAANLIEVHPGCHTGRTNSIHNKVERSIRLGHIVREFGPEPDEIPVQAVLNLLKMRS